jgi:hypothetical protein
MSTTRARFRLSAPRIGLAGLALAAVLTSGAVAGDRSEDCAPTAAPAPVTVTAVPVAPAPASRGATAATSRIGATVDRLAASAPGLRREPLRLALVARDQAIRQGLAKRTDLLTVIDYSLPSTTKRLWVFDVATGKVLFHELVAHGKNTGDNFAQHFSNRDKSLQTSLGLFRTVSTYTGHNGYSLKLDGLEPGFNDQAEHRAVVIHGAPYVSEAFAAQHGRIGRSWGCPALPQAVAAKVIDTIKGGTLVFSYFPDRDWLSHSRFVGAATATLAAGAP